MSLSNVTDGIFLLVMQEKHVFCIENKPGVSLLMVMGNAIINVCSGCVQAIFFR